MTDDDITAVRRWLDDDVHLDDCSVCVRDLLVHIDAQATRISELEGWRAAQIDSIEGWWRLHHTQEERIGILEADRDHARHWANVMTRQDLGLSMRTSDWWESQKAVIDQPAASDGWKVGEKVS